MSKPTTPNNPAQQEPTAEASVLRADSPPSAQTDLTRILGKLYKVLDEIPEEQLYDWAVKDSKQYVLLLKTFADLVKEHLAAPDKRQIIDAEKFDQVARRLNLL